MLEMKTVDNFRTFEVDDHGRELHMTNDVCNICGEQSEVYVSIELGGIVSIEGSDYKDIYICKTCLDKGQQLWNEAFLRHARRNRQEQEAFLRGE